MKLLKRNYHYIFAYWLILILILGNSKNTFGQISIPNICETIKVNESIEIDGYLNENIWQNSTKINNFTQRELDEGKPASELTQFAVAYSEKSLFIAVWCYDPNPDQIVAKQLKRDFDYDTDDNVKITIDTYHDKRNGYLFAINPNGARSDAALSNNGRSKNEDWNGIWDYTAIITDDGWFAEIEIPFSTLKFSDIKNPTWGFNIERNIRRKNETVLWQGWSRDNSSVSVSNAGSLVGLSEISNTSQIEVKPFLTLGVEDETSESSKVISKVGGEINYLITPNLKFNFTVNTDFAQVESDKEEINLTRFSISRDEKRQFFLEGKDYFNFSIQGENNLFYSRRIGIDNKKEIPILGGGKLTGKIDNTEVGILSIQTSAQDEIKSTNYSVIRVKQDILEQSTIGMILTSKNSSEHYNYVYALDGNYSTSSFWGDKNLSIGGFIAQSATKDQNNDANLSHQIFLSYPNDFIEYDLSYSTVQENFNPEIGFIDRSNYKHLATELQINPRPKFIPWIKRAEVKPVDVNFYFSDNSTRLESADFEWRPLGFSTIYGEFFEFNIQRTFDRLNEDFEIYDDITIPVGEYWFTHYEIQLETYEGRLISLVNKINYGDFYNGTTFEYECELNMNLSSHFNLSAEYQRNAIQVSNEKFATDEISARVEYSFSPKLYSSLFGQWNNEDEEINLNFRVNWIPKIGSDFYLVINEKFSRRNSQFDKNKLTIMAKYIWHFVI
ncbi:MAG: DUF5916 domain-containing protein [Melioribacteraceae bacterium]|jgi:hypothetical protein|nr:DUF5916 domain-containing protein [Melioribacteraceae bacterium]